MNPHALERLLIDQALGALDQDTGAVLDAYLRLNPQAAALAGSLGETVTLARRALHGSSSTAVRPFPARRFARAHTRLRLRSASIEITRLAAVLALGLALGLSTPGRRTAAPDAAPAPVSRLPQASPSVPHDVPDSTEFWSSRRWLAQARAGPAEPGVQLEWRSPVKVPRIRPKGDAS